MTAPSLVVDRIVATLATELGSDALDVRSHDGDFNGEKGKDTFTVAAPGVLVACLGMPAMSERDFDPPAAYALLVAVCVARTPKVADGQDSPGDVAMDLAATVASIVSRERWNDSLGVPTTCGRAEKIRVTNEHSEMTRAKGLRVWVVQWLQEIELSPALDVATLNQLAEINMTFEMGDAATPDVAAKQVFP